MRAGAVAVTGGLGMPTFKNDPVESSTDSTSAAIVAENTNTSSSAGVGVHAKSAASGILGESTTWHAVAGITQSTTGGAGVYGADDTGGAGVIGTSKTWVGVFGETLGNQNGPAGVWADGHEGGSGVKGHTNCPGAFGVAGFHLTNQGPGIFGQGNPAGLFEGDVNVTGGAQRSGIQCPAAHRCARTAAQRRGTGTEDHCSASSAQQPAEPGEHRCQQPDRQDHPRGSRHQQSRGQGRGAGWLTRLSRQAAGVSAAVRSAMRNRPVLTEGGPL